MNIFYIILTHTCTHYETQSSLPPGHKHAMMQMLSNTIITYFLRITHNVILSSFFDPRSGQFSCFPRRGFYALLPSPIIATYPAHQNPNDYYICILIEIMNLPILHFSPFTIPSFFCPNFFLSIFFSNTSSFFLFL